MRGSGVKGVEELLGSLPGVVAVRPLSSGLRLRAREVEDAWEKQSILPVRNLGVPAATGRESTCLILKDASFRPPAAPTVYLVEEVDSTAEGPHTLTAAGKVYRVIGEEILPSRSPAAERIIPVSDGFVMYPDRRSGGGVPCSFILPPLDFPELEARAASLGIRDIVSISPSVALDTFLRGELGLPQTNELATVLVGFNLRQAPS
jgi:hypothetical protein